LTLARVNQRRRELATRLALGAGRLQVARQLIIEALAPAVLGGAGGLAIGAAILELLAAGGALADLPNATDVRLHAMVIGIVFAAALGVGLLIGLVPAISAGALTIPQVLMDDNRSGTGGAAARLFRRGLVVAQVSLSVVLLIGATLLFTSFRYLLNLDA